LELEYKRKVKNDPHSLRKYAASTNAAEPLHRYHPHASIIAWELEKSIETKKHLQKNILYKLGEIGKKRTGARSCWFVRLWEIS
jgi:hypothetical protein